jgi:hypothetical protein
MCISMQRDDRMEFLRPTGGQVISEDHDVLSGHLDPTYILSHILGAAADPARPGLSSFKIWLALTKTW